MLKNIFGRKSRDSGLLDLTEVAIDLFNNTAKPLTLTNRKGKRVSYNKGRSNKWRTYKAVKRQGIIEGTRLPNANFNPPGKVKGAPGGDRRKLAPKS